MDGGGAQIIFWGRALRPLHQSQLPPAENKFHVGNGENGLHFWLTPPALYRELDDEFQFTTDVCPWLGRPWQEGDWDGLTEEWGASNYGNIPFGSIMHRAPHEARPRKKGPTWWFRKAIAEKKKGRQSVLIYPLDKWVLFTLTDILGPQADVRNLGDVRFCATEDGSQGKGTGRHIGCFVFRPDSPRPKQYKGSERD